MKICALVTEYNPFHNGHLLHMRRAREVTSCDRIVCIMSGNFVQRGEPALIDKWKRARVAVECGADLVLELPTYYVLHSAEGFALGAVATLSALGVVDSICFGSECGDIGALTEIAGILRTPEFVLKLKAELKKGISWAKARENIFYGYGKSYAQIISEPNNILGVEYIKALLSLKSPIKPYTILREKAHYNSLQPCGSVASATALRHMLKNGEDISPYVPDEMLEALRGRRLLYLEDFEHLILYALRKSSPEEIVRFYGTNEGLNYKLCSASKSSSLPELLESVKSKRYAMSRIKRILLNIMLGNKLPYPLMPSYIRVLAMNPRGAEVLKAAKEASKLPVITKTAAYKDWDDPILKLDFLATDIYNLVLGKRAGMDFTVSPIVLA